jgi:hypothetical protein
MKQQTPVKSAFAKMTPRIVPIPAAPTPAPSPPKPVTQEEKQQQQQAPTATKLPPAPAGATPLPAAAELWLEAANRQDREVSGWIHLVRREASIPALVVSINLHHPLIRQCLDRQDDKLFAWMATIPLAEWLLVRQKHEALSAAILALLRENLLEPAKRKVPGTMFLAQTLADWKPFQSLGSELTRRMEAGEPKVFITSVNLRGEQSEEKKT